MTFTFSEKLACVERELKMRKKVYPRWTVSGNMTEDQATRETALMEEIVADYRAMSERERLL